MVCVSFIYCYTLLSIQLIFLFFFSALHAPMYCLCFMQYPVAYNLHMLLKILVRLGERVCFVMFFCFAPHKADYQEVFIPSVTRVEWSIVRELYIPAAHSDHYLVLVWWWFEVSDCFSSYIYLKQLLFLSWLLNWYSLKV